MYFLSLTTVKLKLFWFLPNVTETANCMHSAHEQSLQKFDHPNECSSLNFSMANEDPISFSMSPHSISWLNTTNERMNFPIENIITLMHTFASSLLCSTSLDAHLHYLFLILVSTFAPTVTWYNSPTVTHSIIIVI